VSLLGLPTSHGPGLSWSLEGHGRCGSTSGIVTAIEVSRRDREKHAQAVALDGP
jgi:hypothetical protein